MNLPDITPADCVALTDDERKALKMLLGSAMQGPHGALFAMVSGVLSCIESGSLSGAVERLEDYRLQVAMLAARAAAKAAKAAKEPR